MLFDKLIFFKYMLMLCIHIIPLFYLCSVCKCFKLNSGIFLKKNFDYIFTFHNWSLAYLRPPAYRIIVDNCKFKKNNYKTIRRIMKRDLIGYSGK